jgi:uncharacterized Fe-S radical SAM superfamily protein PflX
MSPRTLSHSSRSHTLIKKCKLCSRKRGIDEKFSRRGICPDCAVCNMVAQHLGLTHVYYTIEEINSKLVYSYRGPVVKVA